MSLLVLAVGYVLFSEQVTINGTATAKGTFDIETNESLYLVYGVFWSGDWTDKTKYLTYEGIYELPFVQYTN